MSITRKCNSKVQHASLISRNVNNKVGRLLRASLSKPRSGGGARLSPAPPASSLGNPCASFQKSGSPSSPQKRNLLKRSLHPELRNQCPESMINMLSLGDEVLPWNVFFMFPSWFRAPGDGVDSAIRGSDAETPSSQPRATGLRSPARSGPCPRPSCLQGRLSKRKVPTPLQGLLCPWWGRAVVSAGPSPCLAEMLR